MHFIASPFREAHNVYPYRYAIRICILILLISVDEKEPSVTICLLCTSSTIARSYSLEKIGRGSFPRLLSAPLFIFWWWMAVISRYFRGLRWLVVRIGPLGNKTLIYRSTYCQRWTSNNRLFPVMRLYWRNKGKSDFLPHLWLKDKTRRQKEYKEYTSENNDDPVKKFFSRNVKVILIMSLLK